jgi:hypothetical protein
MLTSSIEIRGREGRTNDIFGEPSGDANGDLTPYDLVNLHAYVAKCPTLSNYCEHRVLISNNCRLSIPMITLLKNENGKSMKL